MSDRETSFAGLVAPLSLVALCAWYGCAPHGEALEPNEPEAAPIMPAVNPPAPIDVPAHDPQPPVQMRERRPEREPHTVRERPPRGVPTVTSTTRFDVLAKDAPKPIADDNNEIDWFLGSSSPNPSWSPDGHRIAHYDGRCVGIHDDAGKLVKQLRTKVKNAECRGPRWSPTGHEIVTSHTFHGPGVIFELGRGSRVTGGPGSALMGTDSDGLWSLQYLPDGKRLVGRIHQTGTVLIDGRKPVRTIPLVSDEVPVLQGYFPSFAPNGRHFARVLGEWRGAGELEVVGFSDAGAATASVRDPWDSKSHQGRMGARTVAVPGPILEYEWSRDAAHIVAIRSTQWYPGYGNFDYGFGDLLIIDVPSGETRVAVRGAKNPSWSPDGRFIAFDAAEGDVRLIDVGAIAQGAWTLHAGGIEPKWSPAGHAILTLDVAKQQAVVLRLSTP